MRIDGPSDIVSFRVGERDLSFKVTGNPTDFEKQRLITNLKKYPLTALRSWSEGVIGPDGEEKPLVIHFVAGGEYKQKLVEIDSVEEKRAESIAKHAVGSYSTTKNSLWLNRGFTYWGHPVHCYDDETILHELGHALDDFLVQRTVDGIEVGEFTGDKVSAVMQQHRQKQTAAMNAAGGETKLNDFFASKYAFEGDASHRGPAASCEYFAESIATYFNAPDRLRQIDTPLFKALEDFIKTLGRDEKLGQGDFMEGEKIFKKDMDYTEPPPIAVEVLYPAYRSRFC